MRGGAGGGARKHPSEDRAAAATAAEAAETEGGGKGAASEDSAPAGESFYFRVNGVPIFVQGANLIPLDILPTRVTAGRIRRLLKTAVRSNMNMIRVW